MPKKSLTHRLYNDPAYAVIAKRVGYLGTDYPLSQEESARLAVTHGKEKLIEAAGELLDYDTAGKRATLKPGVRRLCRPILGPSPEEWDEFYAGIDNPPPNPYRPGPPPAEADQRPKRRSALRKKRAPSSAEDAPAEPPQIPVGGPTEAERFANESTARLRHLLDQNRYEVTKYPPDSITFEDALRDIGFIEAELERRRQESEPAAARLSPLAG